MSIKTGIIGDNAVQNELYSLLKSKNCDCEMLNPMSEGMLKKCISECDRIVLPFPSSENKLSSFSANKKFPEYLNKEQLIIGGLPDMQLREQLTEKGISFVDCFEYEPYVMRNAFLTSQGALKLILDNCETQLAGRNVLVTGFGRIGKSLSSMLKGIGLKVSVAVRSEIQAVEAGSMGFDVFGLSSLKSIVFYFDYILNTVPNRLFDRKDISHMRNDAVYFEVASNPFGADPEDFISEEKHFVNASALPGRFYPKAVAQNIYDLILNNSYLMKGCF